jgi:hypothetical protein
MRRARRLASLMTVVAGAWVAACTDLTPVVLAIAPDSGPPDAGPRPDAGEVVDSGPGACELCLRAPDPGGCADEVATCEADPKCAGTFRCVVDNGCLAFASQKDKITCGTPCAVAAGITSQTDPAVGLVFTVLNCQSSACTAPCEASPDGG